MRTFAIALLFAFAARSHAALLTINGNEEGLWTKDAVSVIVGTVKEVQKLDGEWLQGTHQAKLVPCATLAGTFDPSAFPELRLHMWATGYGSALNEPPVENCLVILVLRQDDKGGFYVVPYICTFMPGGRSPVASIKGLDDLELPATLRRIQVARTKSPDWGKRQVEK